MLLRKTSFQRTFAIIPKTHCQDQSEQFRNWQVGTHMGPCTTDRNRNSFLISRYEPGLAIALRLERSME